MQNQNEIGQEVKTICKFVRGSNFFNKNTNASKKHIARLTELGLIDMMEQWRTASGINYHQAAAVIEAAEDTGSQDVAWNPEGDAEIIKNDPSNLNQLLEEEINEAQVVRHVITFGLEEKGMFNTITEVKVFLQNETDGQPGSYTVFEYVGHGAQKNPMAGNNWLDENA